jgi:hypothetical protein
VAILTTDRHRPVRELGAVAIRAYLLNRRIDDPVNHATIIGHGSPTVRNNLGAVRTQP